MNTVEINEAEGNRQEFIADCEVCCNPMEIKVTIDKIDGESIINAEVNRANT